MAMRKHHTPALKAQLVLEMLREDQTVSQIAAAAGVHPSQLHKWKRYTVDHLADLFQAQQSAAQVATEYEQKLESLYAELGKTTTQLTWLKKKSGLEPQ